MPAGFTAAQVCHAAGESSPGGLPPGTYAVVLAVRTEAVLEIIARQLCRDGVPHAAVREPDAPWSGQLTAIGLVPTVDRSAARKILGGLPLLWNERK